MKTRKFTKRIFNVFFIASLFMACSPEDGEDGAIGPQGPQGEQGATGTTGADGQQGEPGTANVIYSDWIARDFETNIASETNQQLLVTFNGAEFNLNEDVLLVYGRREVNVIVSEINLLPYILAGQQEYYGFGVSSFSGGSSLRVQVSTLDGGTNLFTYFDDFRYVIIPGGQQASTSKSALDYTKMSYEEITKLFNIKN